MIYDNSNEIERKKFLARAEYLASKGKVSELTDKSGSVLGKTNPQNRYMHLICAYFGVEAGYTMEYVKENYFKALLSPDIFDIDKVANSGLQYKDLKSWSKCTKEEGQIAIDRFLKWSNDGGILLPNIEDEAFLRHCHNEVERMKHFI